MAEWGDGWDHRYMQVGDLRFHYVTAGSGPLLLLLHGFPEFWYSWRHQLSGLAGDFRMVAPDLRGYNYSDKPLGVSQYRMDRLAGDVLGMLAALGEESAYLAAHDWGGAVAWVVAAHAPGAIRKLAVLNCPHPSALLYHLMTNPSQRKRSRYMFQFQVPRLPETIIRARDYRVIEKAFRGWAIDKSCFSDADIEMYKQAAAQPGALTGGINYYRAAFRQGLRDQLQALRGRRSGRAGAAGLPAIQVPTLLIWAEEDRALGRELTEGMERYFAPGISFERKYIPACSHWVQQEQPDLVNGYLRDFFLPPAQL